MADPLAAGGPRRQYGDKITYHAVPDRYRVQTTGGTGIYQAVALRRCFAQPLNIVINVKTNLQPKHERMSSGSAAISTGFTTS